MYRLRTRLPQLVDPHILTRETMEDFQAGLKLRIVTTISPPHNTAAPQITERITRLCRNQSALCVIHFV